MHTYWQTMVNRKGMYKNSLGPILLKVMIKQKWTAMNIRVCKDVRLHIHTHTHFLYFRG